jgi:hypothetical protein
MGRLRGGDGKGITINDKREAINGDYLLLASPDSEGGQY